MPLVRSPIDGSGPPPEPPAPPPRCASATPATLSTAASANPHTVTPESHPARRPIATSAGILSLPGRARARNRLAFPARGLAGESRRQRRPALGGLFRGRLARGVGNLAFE